ncbi:MAG: hypothetical protein J1F10_05810 [Muribaculaceae bacterium]|nr:hypothetical protein [Muribaculaceae bacterium]
MIWYRILLTLISLMMTWGMSQASVRVYYNKTNGFDGIAKSKACSVDEAGDLVLGSNSGTPGFALMPVPDDINDRMVYSLRVRSLEAQNQHYSILINFRDSLNYDEIKIVSGNTDLYEPYDRRYFQIEFWKHTEGMESCMAVSKKFYKDLGRKNDYNTLCLNFKNDCLTFQIGRSTYETVFELQLPLDKMKKIGVLSVQKIGIKNIYIDYEPLGEPMKAQIYNYAAIDSLISNSDEPIVGYWNYFDRKINVPKVQLGGKYSLAIIPDVGTQNFNVLYIDNAKVNESKWKCGMIKGRLYPTGVYGNYNLVWYDADMNEMNDDCYVSLTGGEFVEFVFPVEKSSFRLIKVKNN